MQDKPKTANECDPEIRRGKEIAKRRRYKKYVIFCTLRDDQR